MEECDHENQNNEAFVDLKKVNQVSDEECTENVRKGEYGIKHLKLFFANMESLLDGLSEGLRVVECVIISETRQGDETQSDPVNALFGDAEFERRLVRFYIRHI